jgi:hypothetical protein
MSKHYDTRQGFPMQLDEVKALLDSENPQKRMSAITALRNYEDTIAVPLLVRGIFSIGQRLGARPRRKCAQ